MKNLWKFLVRTVQRGQEMEKRARKSKALCYKAFEFEPVAPRIGRTSRKADVQKAISLYEKAIEVDSRNVSAYHDLARIHALELNNLEKAEYYCRKGYGVTDIPPEIWTPGIGVDDVRAEVADDFNHLMMTIRLKQGKPREAQEYLNKMKSFFDAYSKGKYFTAKEEFWKLGRPHYSEREWEEAYASYREPISEMELIRAETITEVERTLLTRRNITAFERLVICCMHTGRFSEAAEYAERGKARNLINLLTWQDLRPRNAPEADYLPEAKPLSFADMQQLARDLSALPPLAPPSQGGETTCIVQLWVTEVGTYAFLITGTETTLSEANVISIPAFTSDRLGELLIKWEGEGEARVPVDGWLMRYYDYRAKQDDDYLANRKGPSPITLQAKQAWHDCLDETLGTWYRELFAPVHQRLKELGVGRLVLVPTRGLSLLPLHAMYYPVAVERAARPFTRPGCSDEPGEQTSRSLSDERRYLLDDFEITYAPSCAILQRCVARDAEGRVKERLTAVANPGKNLPDQNLAFSDWEVAEIEGMFPDAHRRVLWHEQADWDAVLAEMPNGNFLHFSCHGTFNLNNPLASALLLAGEKPLTLGEIFEHFDASQAHLVSLSACETGITATRNAILYDVTDEYVGLPAGFLFARANAVVASLWAVSDFSTALLMTRLYENILQRGMGRAAGLREAQCWLRGLSKEEAVQLLQAKELELRAAGRDMMATELAKEREVIQSFGEPNPFAHPYWWGAFQCVGAF
ncbi:CHAT domain-containing protein [Candidatus Poribacteria bacterium]|nr:CHAT domain-containing protein [Candidatus Poribacteria bacterium]